MGDYKREGRHRKLCPFSLRCYPRPGFETERSSPHLTKVVPSHNQNTTVTQNVIHPLPVSKPFRLLIKIPLPVSYTRPVEFSSLRPVLRNQHFHKKP